MRHLLVLLILVLLTCICQPAMSELELTTVTCAEDGFSVMIPVNCTPQYVPGTGLQVFVETPGYIPYVIVTRRPADKQFSNPTNYLNNIYREYMEDQYGDNMIGTNPAREWEVGGKKLLGARYLYKVGETTVCMLRLIEIREDGDVEYAAKYIDGEDENAMVALDVIVKYYTIETDYDEALGSTVAPVDMRDMEVNTESGVYWAAITDADRIEDGGFFTASLYMQDLYPAEQIESLSEGARVRVNGQEFTVTSIIHHDKDTIEIYTREEFNGYIVFNKASDVFYTALVNDWVPCTHIAEQKIMLPLVNDFTFTWIGDDESTTVYDADSFIVLLEDVELTQYNTLLQYNNGLVMMIIHTSYPFGPGEE